MEKFDGNRDTPNFVLMSRPENADHQQCNVEGQRSLT